MVLIYQIPFNYFGNSEDKTTAYEVMTFIGIDKYYKVDWEG